jgi:anti-sigma factor RsiW
MRGHVDAESLALYAEGLLSRRRAARVRAHLPGCAECTRTAAALGEVTTRLSQVPAPPLPATVSARLDAALSAESARRAASPAPAPASPVPAGSPEPRPPRRNPLWSPVALRVLAAAGVTLVVAGGIGYAVSQSGSSSSPSGSSAAPPVTSHRHSPARAVPFLSPGQSVNQPGISGGSASTRYVQTGTDFRPATLATQAKRVMAVYGVSGMSGPDVRQPASVSSSVKSCAARVAGQQHAALVDLARYEQHPAIVVVLASAAGTPERVIVVTPSCSHLDSATLTVATQPGAG